VACEPEHDRAGGPRGGTSRSRTGRRAGKERARAPRRDQRREPGGHLRGAIERGRPFQLTIDDLRLTNEAAFQSSIVNVPEETVMAVRAMLFREAKIRTTNFTFLFWDLCYPLGSLLVFRVGINDAVGQPLL